MSVATAPTSLTGRLRESARITPSHGCAYLMEFLRAPLTIFRARSIPTGSAPTMLASMSRLPVPQNGSRNASPGWTPERFTSARESFGKMADGWKNALLRGLRVTHPCLIERGHGYRDVRLSRPRPRRRIPRGPGLSSETFPPTLSAIEEIIASSPFPPSPSPNTRTL